MIAKTSNAAGRYSYCHPHYDISIRNNFVIARSFAAIPASNFTFQVGMSTVIVLFIIGTLILHVE